MSIEIGGANDNRHSTSADQRSILITWPLLHQYQNIMVSLTVCIHQILHVIDAPLRSMVPVCLCPVALTPDLFSPDGLNHAETSQLGRLSSREGCFFFVIRNLRITFKIRLTVCKCFLFRPSPVALSECLSHSGSFSLFDLASLLFRSRSDSQYP